MSQYLFRASLEFFSHPDAFYSYTETLLETKVTRCLRWTCNMLYVDWHRLSYVNVQLLSMDVTVAYRDVRLITVPVTAMAVHRNYRTVF